jgi:ubiquinone/menaquinone biosynthesis C-methylase UbiE
MAWLYDIYDAPMEWMGTRRRRARLLAWASGRVLEVGVGTGRNLEHYPNTVTLSAIDVSPLMLARARRRAGSLDRAVAFEVADVAALPYRDDTFDTTVATCVFCSVADPVEGLRELGRVTKAEGRILLLEHVRPRNRLLGWLADLATTVTRACLASVQTGAPRRTSPRPT